MNFIQWCCERGAKSHRKRTKKPWRKRQSRSWRYSFHKYFTTFFYWFLFFNYFTLSLFFLYFFYPRHLPTPTPKTLTHDPRPLPTTYDPRHLATLVRIWSTNFHTYDVSSYYQTSLDPLNVQHLKRYGQNVVVAFSWIFSSWTMNVS